MRRFRIATDDDVKRVEALPYAEVMPHGNVHAALASVADACPERPALTWLETAAAEAPVRRWSYRRLLDDIRRAANLFRTLGGNDPRVAMLLPAMPQAYITLLGAETAGLVCPINYLLSDRHIAELLRATHANMLVALGPHPQLDIWSKVGALGRECPELRHVLSVGGASGAPDFDASLAMHCADTLDFDAAADADSVVALFHTGGTTGAPKLARHRHRNQLHASWSAAQMMAMTADDVIVNGFPLFHVAGSFVYGLSALLSGAEVLLPTLLGMRNPDFVRSYWEVVERHRVSLLAAVPTVISTLMEVPVNGARIETAGDAQARRRVAGPAVDRRGQGLLGLIHPPVGMVVFVVKSVVQEVSFTTIFKGVLPFVVTDILRLVILISFPAIALWLPGRMG